MFRRLPETDAGSTSQVDIVVDGAPLRAQSGQSVAAALLAAGHLVCRTTPVTGAPRGPFCMMGVCFDCLVMIDGAPNRQGCLVTVQPGMRIDTQRGARSIELND